MQRSLGGCEITWRRAGAMYGAIGQIVLLTIVAGLLAAGITLPAIAIAGLATRNTANTFNNAAGRDPR